MARSSPSSDRRLVELFLDMLAAERGAAANTLAAYTRDLDDFSAHLHAARRTVATARSDDVRAYLAALAGRAFSPASVARRLSAIRQLFRFLYAEGHRTDDPGAAVEGPNQSPPLTRSIRSRTLSIFSCKRVILCSQRSRP